MIVGVAFSNKLCDKKVVFIKLMALIAQSHLLKQRAPSFKATSELVFVFSLSDVCSHVYVEAGKHLSQAALHVCHEKVQRL